MKHLSVHQKQDAPADARTVAVTPEHPFNDEGGPLSQVLSRRSALWVFGGGGLLSLATLAGCGGGSTGSSGTGTSTTGTTSSTASGTASSSSTSSTASTGTSTGTATSSGSTSSGNTTASTPTPTPTAMATPVSGGTTTTSGCTLIPTETAGPYPLLTVLSSAGIVRNNITEGKTGVPLTLTLNLQNTGSSCGPISNAAVYIWHCDKDGQYSGYTSGANGTHAGETYLRGVQVSASDGTVTFTTIYPGWYAGRITHIHFQVYLGGSASGMATATSQIALPQDITTAVYNSSLYAAHGQNTSVTSFAQDGVFSDGTTYQMATVTGSVASGYTATLNVGIKAS